MFPEITNDLADGCYIHMTAAERDGSRRIALHLRTATPMTWKRRTQTPVPADDGVPVERPGDKPREAKSCEDDLRAIHADNCRLSRRRPQHIDDTPQVGPHLFRVAQEIAGIGRA